MDWHAHVDIYCERVDPSFWAEPLNAVSNAAFILAALWGAYSAAKRQIWFPSVWLCILLAFLIGTGSFLFHTHATVWASLTDVLPIWAFVATYAVVTIALIGKATPRSIAIGIVVLVIAGTLLYLFAKAGAPEPEVPHAPSRFNGSEQYLPAVIAMIIFTSIALWKKHPIRYWFLSATVVFMVSLTFRTFDMAVCEAMPRGIHFIWHILNGLMIGLLLQALILNVKRTPSL
ncbi:MAG: ceramidase domain-containing protein [Litoreibacter sp.]|nr:ceramidase domain-containing protein [Litoreibacter sp.]MCY4334073.1 ceramidase domain-containing protein [Litoreibacter sp.]